MIRQAPTGVAAFVDRFGDGPVGEPVLVGDPEEFVGRFGPLDQGPGSLAVAAFFDNGGEQAWVVRTHPDPGTSLLEALLWGIDQLGPVAHDLLCVPAATLDGSGADPTTPQIVAFAGRAAGMCADRRAILLLDPPSWIADAAAMAAWVRANPLTDPNTALWYPRVVVAGAGAETGAAGAIAGMIARTDRDRGVWSAPAGLRATLAGVSTTAHLRQSDVALLNPLGVNTIMNHRGGPVSWGARTMAGRDDLGSEWKYLPVRRLALNLETSIRQGLHWHLDEVNEEALWARLRAETAEFLHELFRAGALQGSRPNEAYFVSCDAETTSEADVEAGRVHVVVGFSALRPAEFQVLDVELARPDIATSSG